MTEPIDYEGDADAAPPSDALERITSLADLLREQTTIAEDLERRLRDAQAAKRRTEREDLPMLMKELKLSEIKLEDGTTVTVVPDLDCGVSAERMPAAVAWLKERDYDGIVKTRLLVEFGRDEAEAAEHVAEQVRELTDHDVELAPTIHPQTLKAFIKERREAGEDVPADLFGIMPFDRAKLKAPRAVGTRARKR